MGEKASAKQDGVLASLPTTRPQRIGKPRAADAEGPPQAARKPTPKPRAPAARKAPARRRGPAAAPARKPAPVSAGSPPLERVPRMTEMPPARPIGPPTGTELVVTTIQAAGELAQIGLTLGGRALKRAVDRIPRL